MSVIAVVYTSLVAFRQTDMKKLIAYSSVAHMGFVTMGIFSGNAIEGIQGAIFQMLSHGVISGALFLCVGVVYDRMHTREIAFYGGLVTRMPGTRPIFMLFTMGNVGLPGTSGFVGEILTMTGVYQVVHVDRDFRGVGGDPLGRLYADAVSRRGVSADDQPEAGDHHRYRLAGMAIFVPLILSTLYMGVQPNSVLDLTRSLGDPARAGLPARRSAGEDPLAHSDHLATQLAYAYPELILAVGALSLLVLGAFMPKQTSLAVFASCWCCWRRRWPRRHPALRRCVLRRPGRRSAAATFSKVAIYIASRRGDRRWVSPGSSAGACARTSSSRS